MTESDEVRAHILDLLECLADDIIRHRGGHTRMILMILRAAQQQPLTVQLEWPVHDPLKEAHAEVFGHLLFALW